jgi:hypothetical protein
LQLQAIPTRQQVLRSDSICTTRFCIIGLALLACRQEAKNKAHSH